MGSLPVVTPNVRSPSSSFRGPSDGHRYDGFIVTAAGRRRPAHSGPDGMEPKVDRDGRGVGTGFAPTIAASWPTRLGVWASSLARLRGPFAGEVELVPKNTTWTVGHEPDGGVHPWNCRTIVVRRI